MKFKSLLYLYDEILLNKNKWTTETCKKTDKSHKHFAKWKKQREKLYDVWFHLCKILEQAML